MAKKELSHDYANISICLLGCSNSGKSTFYSGIRQALVQDFVKFGNHVIRLNMCSISSGVATVKQGNPNVEESVTHVNAPQDQLKGMTGNVSTGNAFSQVAGNAFSQVAGNAFSSSGAASGVTTENGSEKDNRQVNNINIAGGLSNAVKLSAEFDKQFDISTKFNAQTATTRYIILSFEVKIDEEVRCILHLTDYAGELISLEHEVPDSMLRMLTDHLKRSEAAIVLSNTREMGNVITTPTTNNPSMFLVNKARAFLGANRINSLLTNIDNDKFTFLLALTQVDSPQVKPEVKQNNFKTVSNNLKEYIYNLAFLKAEHEKMWSTGIIPVSAIGTKRDGSYNVDINNNLLPDAELNQQGIDKAILFCLYTSTLQKLNALDKEMKDTGGIFGDRKLYNNLKAQRDDLLVIKNFFAENEHYFDCINERKIALQKVSTLK